jgi:hypothetical protein
VAQFVHLTSDAEVRSIRINGIKVSRKRGAHDGVFAHPQTENFVVTHQWMRELRRFRGQRIVGVRIRLPDRERVWIGKFNAEHIDVSASEALGIARDHQDPLGLQVIIPRAVRASEVQAFYTPPKVVGWRYYPTAKGRKPCPCPYCQRGEPFSKHIRIRDRDA